MKENKQTKKFKLRFFRSNLRASLGREACVDPCHFESGIDRIGLAVVVVQGLQFVVFTLNNACREGEIRFRIPYSIERTLVACACEGFPV